MKIFNNPNISQIMKLYNKSVKPIEKYGKVTAAKDQLEISEKAKDFQVAMKAFKKLPEVRQEKVKELKEKIETNNYNVSGKEIADKIIEGIMMDKRI